MNTNEVMAQVAKDEALRAKLQAECKTPEELYQALQQLGLTDSKEEFLAAVKKQLVAAGVTSEEELDKAVAAGGKVTINYSEGDMDFFKVMKCLLGGAWYSMPTWL